jgi:GNAT superfamily N-acetyltransferase
MDKAVLMADHRAKFPDNRMRSIGKEYYEWKIFTNPVAVGDICLQERDGKVAGSSALMPRKIAIYDKIFFGGETADSFTDPAYRRQGINSKALKECIDYALSRGMGIVYGPPNKANYGLHIKLGYVPCSHIKWGLLRKSLNGFELTFKLIAKMALGRDFRKNARHLRFLVGSGAARRHGPRAHENRENDWDIVETENFNQNVEPLWGKPRFSFFIYRDSRYLNWRYFENPDKFFVLAALKGEEYLGYLAVKTTKDRSAGIFCDFVTLDDRMDVFRDLVGVAEMMLKKDAVKEISLRCAVGSSYYEELARMGYYDPGPERYQPVLIYGGTELGRRLLETEGKWHFTYGDTDEV